MAWNEAQPTATVTRTCNFARWLANVLAWAVRGVELMKADYTSVLIGRYQEEMLKGIWSANNTPLASETVNARVRIVLEYQMWAADKGAAQAVRNSDSHLYLRSWFACQQQVSNQLLLSVLADIAIVCFSGWLQLVDAA